MIIVRNFSSPDHSGWDDVIEVELPYDQRKKSRLLAVSRCGREVGIQLPRGNELLHGQRLVADSGEHIEIVASAETVSTVTSPNPLLLLKAAYHLGNRHVPLQVAEGWLRYQHDHVLDDMVAGLGLSVVTEQAPFQPESGAYHRHAGDHHHQHDHAHG
jgi:urease accessory protein